MYREIEEANPAVVVVDPVNNLTSAGIADAVKATLLRLVDYLKTRHITALFTSLTRGHAYEQSTDIGISSLMDTWILLRTSEKRGERHRAIYVLKSRGMPHSNELCPYRITDQGIQLARRSSGPLKRKAR
jgi:circadian clock protein KaiC